ncbi:hypothetical protein [Saccharopolyspora shandongensis]|uniref:hypothetical protein n=1 Tax=Saccharopolyspora shandongensis TaxID=418495 RepID=UPI0033CD1A61
MTAAERGQVIDHVLLIHRTPLGGHRRRPRRKETTVPTTMRRDTPPPRIRSSETDALRGFLDHLRASKASTPGR